MAENRGRPSEQVVKLDKWVLDTEDSTWYYDKNKNKNGCWKVEQKFQPGSKPAIEKIDPKPYGKMPTVVVFKTSNRSNARTKMKVINKNVDYVISAKKLPGIPERAEWLEIGIGRSFIEQYKKKYNLA
tara:strand:+ start:3264 stop:3647 length:384 start_codon:yes stop_codon:yes gene_type:complete